MTQPLFICYTHCGTCRKAAKWLKENSIEVETRDIATQNPSQDELADWIPKSGKPIAKFFNTSGLRYKELKMKDVVKTASANELLAALASEGMLVKRPILVTDKTVLVGFDEQEWKEAVSK